MPVSATFAVVEKFGRGVMGAVYAETRFVGQGEIDSSFLSLDGRG